MPAATTGRPTAPAAGPEAFTGEDFYAVPDPLPAGDHGDLIRYEQVEPAAGGEDSAGATTWRIMYLSESLAGEPIAVTGTVAVPGGEAPDGGRDLVTDAHGTTGIADECAPSTLEDPRRAAWPVWRAIRVRAGVDRLRGPGHPGASPLPGGGE